MTIDEKDLLNSILNSLSNIDFIKPEDFPNIDLYMDQVTTFMDTQLSACKRHPEDKVLTKTMINNYAKNDLLPPPVKKKYSKEHMFVLIFIYYFKNILSIGDIQAILNPITDKYFASGSDFGLENIYSEIFCLEESGMLNMQKDLTRKYQTSLQTFADQSKDDQEELQRFSFICMLCFDVYVKKQLIERMIDSRLPQMGTDKTLSEKGRNKNSSEKKRKAESPEKNKPKSSSD